MGALAGLSRFVICGAVVLAATLVGPAAQARYAAIVVDHASGDTLLGEDVDETVHPASLTKMMTTYLAFEAIAAKKVTLDTRLPVSARAASRPPSRLGLKPGATIRLEDAILALLTKSANDVASVVAEGLAPSEDEFARRMTQKAHALGMNHTEFHNASGLPHPDQVTSARDMALLARHLIDDFPEYYPYFSRATFTYGGRVIRNHNFLLGRYPGTDGLKTGYINASGYNLVASSVRGGRRLIAVVLGGKTARSRDRQVMRLLDDGFASLQIARAMPGLGTGAAAGITVADAEPVTVTRTRRGRIKTIVPAQASAKGPATVVRYVVQVGSFRSERSARAQARAAAKKAPKAVGAKPVVVMAQRQGRQVYLARLTGFDGNEAQVTCKALKKKGDDCMVVRAGSA